MIPNRSAILTKCLHTLKIAQIYTYHQFDVKIFNLLKNNPFTKKSLSRESKAKRISCIISKKIKMKIWSKYLIFAKQGPPHFVVLMPENSYFLGPSHNSYSSSSLRHFLLSLSYFKWKERCHFKHF